MPAECRPFTKTFPAGTEFEIKSWSTHTAGTDLLSNIVLSKSVELPDRKVEKPKAAEGEAARLVLLDTKGDGSKHEIPLNDKGKIDDTGHPVKLQKPLVLDVSKWTADAKEALFDDSGSVGGMTAADSDSGGQFRFNPARSKQLRRSLFAAALKELVIPAGAEITVTDFKPDDLTVTYILRNPSTPEAVKHKAVPKLDGWFGLKFKLPHVDTLTMVPTEFNRGSLNVQDSHRTVALTSLNLALTHSKIDFDGATFRGCIGFKNNSEKESVLDLNDTDLKWVEIENVSVVDAKAGVAQISVALPGLPEANVYTPGFQDDTVGNWFLGGRENAKIILWASNGDSIVYTGATAHFIDDRKAALWIAGGAFLAAYAMIVLFWMVYTRDQSSAMSALWPVNLVRGHNGTASLSNLQILWWTLVVFALMVYVWVATGGLATLNNTILWLLGVGGAGSLAAKAVAINFKQNAPTIEQLKGTPDKAAASAWQLISVNDRLDLTKLQMLLFTVITGIYVVATVLSQVTFPEIPDELLMLMGISNGVYVLGKLATTDPLADNPYAIVAGLQYELTLREDVIAGKEKTKSELEEKIEGLKAEKKATDLDDDKLAAIKTELEKLKAEKKELLEKIEAAKKKITDE